MNRKDDRRTTVAPTAELSNSASAAGSDRHRVSGFNFNWFISKAVRQGTALRKHVHKLLNHQRDLLGAQFVQQIEMVLAETDAVLRQKPDVDAISRQMDRLEKDRNERLKTYPNAAWRENVVVLLATLAVRTETW